MSARDDYPPVAGYRLAKGSDDRECLILHTRTVEAMWAEIDRLRQRVTDLENEITAIHERDDFWDAGVSGWDPKDPQP